MKRRHTIRALTAIVALAVAGGGAAIAHAATLESDTRTATINGKTVTLTQTGSTWQGAVNLDNEKPSNGTANSHKTFDDLTSSDEGYDLILQPMTGITHPKLGVESGTGTVQARGKLATDTGNTIVAVNYDYTTGAEAKYNGQSFVKNGATWELAAPDTTLDAANNAGVNQIELSNGLSASVNWGVVTTTPEPASPTAPGTVTYNSMSHGIATGEDEFGQAWRVLIDARKTFVQTTTETRTATIGGTDNITLSKTQEKWRGTVTLGAEPTVGTGTVKLGWNKEIGGTETSTSTYPLTKGSPLVTVTHPKLGQTRTQGTVDYTADDTVVTANWDGTTGDEVTVKDGGAFAPNDDGTWSGSRTSTTLSEDNVPGISEIELSDGQHTGIIWGAPSKTTAGDVSFTTRTGTATFTVDGQTAVVTVVASRSYDDAITSLSLLRTDASGTTTSTPLDLDGTTHTVTLDPALALDRYDLAVGHGPDATVSAVSKSLGYNASRQLEVTLNGVKHLVTVSFPVSDLVPDSPAKLSGIYVNLSGEAVKGQLIDNWDANRLNYTVNIGRDARSPYVLPEAEDGVTVVQGDVKQTGDATSASWTVSAQGKTRTYTVTVVREHEPNAVERFTPKDPVVQESKVEASSPQDTELASHGYVANGKYIAAKGDDYRIPEGGVFAIEPKIGQSTSVGVQQTGPMAYTYTVSMLSPDGTEIAQHVYKATYITGATHKAALTGILVNGTAIEGFEPGVHEYTAVVGDLEAWTIVPTFDKDTGMSVVTKKDGAKATITVTSADGLVEAVYTVNVRLGEGDPVVGIAEKSLAQTGAGVTAAIVAALTALGAGIAVLALSFAKRRN